MALSTKSTIAYLKKIERGFPDDLWLWAADGRLYLMRKKTDGSRAVISSGGVDQDYIIAEFNIETDGGDW